jgi:two-component system, cell cycle response regulator CtrA
MRLLVVTNSDALTTTLGLELAAVTETVAATEAAIRLQSGVYDLLVLDMRSAPGNGLDFIFQLRASRNEIPLVAITSANPRDRFTALALGATDTVSDPIDCDELSSSILRLVESRRNSKTVQLTIGNLAFCADRRDAFVAGVPVELNEREYLALEYLALASGRPISKSELLQTLYDAGSRPPAIIIDVFISRIRLKLQRAGADLLIKTALGRGYFFDGQSLGRGRPVDDQDRRLAA